MAESIVVRWPDTTGTLEEKGERTMCLSCGCGEPNADHGDTRHITFGALKRAAEAAQIKPDEAAKNIQETLKKVKV